MRTKKVQTLVIPRNGGRRERRVPYVMLSGKWLREHGVCEGETIYIYERADGILLSKEPPVPVQMTPIDEIRLRFQELGIPITRE